MLITKKQLKQEEMRKKLFIRRCENRIMLNKLMLEEDTLDANNVPTLRELMKEFEYEGPEKEMLYF